MKKFIKTIGVCAVVLCAMFIFAACDLYKPQKVELDLQSVDLELDYNQSLELSDMVVRVIYRDENIDLLRLSNSEITLDYGSFDKTVPGEHEIKVTYKGVSATFKVIVKAPTVNGFRVDRSAIPTNILWGEDVDFSKLKVYSTSLEGKEELLTTAQYNLDISTFNKHVAGDKTITVGYSSYATQSFVINVAQAKEIGFEINTDSVKKDYFVGQDFSSSGLIVNAVFEDGAKERLLSNYTVSASNYNKNAAGNYNIVVSYKDYTKKQFSVSVKVALENGFEIDRTDIATSVGYNVTPDFSKLKVYATYQDGARVLLTSDKYTISGYTATPSGEKTVRVSYKEYESKYFKVNVLAPVEIEFEIDTTNVDKSVPWGTAFDINGIVVKGIYEDASKQDVATYTVDRGGYPATGNVAGDYTITINYKDYTSKTFIITIEDALENGFEIDRTLIPLAVNYDVTPDFSRLKVYKTYQDGVKVLLSADDYTVSGYTSTPAGVKTITVSYSDYDDITFNVVVSDPGEEGFEIITTDVDTSVPWGTAFNIDGIVVKAIYQDESRVVLANTAYGVDNGGYPVNGRGAGEFEITISYKDYAVKTFTITIEPALESGFSIDRSDIASSVPWGTVIDFSTVEVFPLFEDDSLGVEALVAGTDYTIDYSEYNKNLEGTYKIYVRGYKEYAEKFFEVSVAAPLETGFIIDTTDVDVSVPWGTAFNIDDIVVQATFEQDGLREDISAYTVNNGGYPVDGKTAGDYTITISYKEYADKTFTITIEPALENGFSIDRSNIATSVAWNTEIDFSQVIVYPTFEDNTTGIVAIPSLNYTIDSSLYNKSVQGTYKIYVRDYKEYADLYFEVTVNAPVETGIRLDRGLIPESAPKGTAFDASKLKVYAVYEDGHEVLLGQGDYTVNYSTYNSSVVATYTISVTYKSFAQRTFTISIVEISDIIVEGETFVLFQQKNYTFSGANQARIVNNDTLEEYALEGTLFPDLPIGNYTVYYKNNANLDRQKALKVVDFVSSFGMGEDYITQQSAETCNNYLNCSYYFYSVGNGSPFYYDISITNPEGNPVLADSSILNYTFYLYNTDTYVFDEVSLGEIGTQSGKNFIFNSSVINRRIKTMVSLKYQELGELHFEFDINDGVNVYNDAELKSAFGNLNVKTINIHREIIATLNPNQYNPDGTPKNYSDNDAYIEYNADGTLKSNTSGCVYVRVGNNSEDNHLVINGNLFDINAKNLPRLTTNVSNYAGQPQWLTVTGSTTDTKIVNAQSAIFYIRVRQSNHEQLINNAFTVDGEGVAHVEPKTYLDENNNSVVFNDISILGNTQAPAGDNSHNNMQRVKENSGGYPAVRVADCDARSSNSIIKFSCIAFTIIGPGSDLRILDTLIDESWANGIYVHGGSEVQLIGSRVLSSGGSAVWMEDTNYKWGSIFNTSFIMDSTSIVENFVSGTEAWFEAYGMAGVATAALANIEGGVSLLTSSNKTIIKTMTNDATGGTFETFNFGIVLVDKYSLEDVPSGITVEQRSPVIINDTYIQRTNTSLSSDARYVNVAGLMGPVGSLSDTNAFNAAVYNKTIEYMSQGDEQATAQTKAFQFVLASSFFVEGAKYLEVVQSVTGVGKMILVTEFM